MDRTEEFVYKGVSYFVEDNQFWKIKFSKKLNVKKRDFYKFKERANERSEAY